MKVVIFDIKGTLVDVYRNADRPDAFPRLYNGVDELLPILRNMGVKIAAQTSSHSDIADYLEATGIADYFDLIVTDAHVANPKPHREGVDLILAHLMAKPHDAVIVGDSTSDIFAGKNAGVGKAVGVTHGLSRAAELESAGASHINGDIPSLLDVLE